VLRAMSPFSFNPGLNMLLFLLLTALHAGSGSYAPPQPHCNGTATGDCGAGAEAEEAALLQRSVHRAGLLSGDTTDGRVPHQPKYAPAVDSCPNAQGETCNVLNCRPSSGSQCVNGMCVCPDGTCAIDGSCMEPSIYMCYLRSKNAQSGVSLIAGSAKQRPASIEDQSKQGAGARAWVTQEALDYIAANAVSFIEQSMEKATFPNIEGEHLGFAYKVQHLKVHIGANPLGAFVPGVGLKIRVQDFHVGVNADFSASLGPLWTQGEVNVQTKADKTWVDTVIGIAPVPDGHASLWVQSINTSLVLDEVTYSGSRLSGLVDTLTWLFDSFLQCAISGLLSFIVHAIACDGISWVLYEVDLLQPLPLPPPFNITALSLGVVDIHTTKDYMAIELNGTVVDTSDSHIVYPGSPTALATEPETTETMISAGVTQWIPNSLFYILQEKALITYTVTPDQVPSSFGMAFDVNSFLMFAPGLVWKYAGRKMSVTVRAAEAPKANLVDGYLSTLVSVYIDFNVLMDGGASEKAFTLQTGLDIAATAWVEQPKWPKGSSFLEEDGPICPGRTGGTCSWRQCDSSRKAVCRDGYCECPKGFCSKDGTCAPAPTEPPKAPPRDEFPPQIVKFYFKNLDTTNMQVVSSNVGDVYHTICFNWVVDNFMPLVETLVNTGAWVTGIPINTTALPVAPRNSSASFMDGVVRLFTDLEVDAMYKPVGAFLTNKISTKVQHMLNTLMKNPLDVNFSSNR